MIEIIQENGLLHLRNGQISYVMAVMRENVLAHLYFGPRLAALHPDGVLRACGSGDTSNFRIQECGLDRLPQEYPVQGLGDHREGALTAECPGMGWAVDLRFIGAEILEGKPSLEGLPATFGDDGKTLKITLADKLTGLKAELNYTVFEGSPAIVRSARIINGGDESVTLTNVQSLCMDLMDSKWDLITLSGSWARERGVYRRALMPGHQGVSTLCGASSLQQSPFLALARKDTNEDAGEAIGAALVYSGNFAARASVYQNDGTRISLGINPRDFAWRLEVGESFQAPEAALVYSDQGLGGMSRAFHRLWENHLLPRRWVSAHRPVLLNSWEAAYFDFDEEKLVSIAECAARAGVELFVMDDGWFGHRDDDSTSLGDWDVDLKKLPGGLRQLGDRIRALGLQFGIWMEPEMISPKSNLYRTHPDWAIHVPGREPIEARHQLTLDMSRQDVQEFVFNAVSNTLRESGAAYLKWDMNRNFSNIGSACLPKDRQRELPHRYILGLYAVMDRLVRAFPDVLIEGCSSGGGRYDPGMLYYVPQFWCSDDTDAVMRCRIQYGTTLFLPPSSMGSHVSAVPNHQTGRVTPLESRFAVALGGCFGYELDPRKLTEEEQAALQKQIFYAKETESTRARGGLYRLLSPFEDNDTAWITVSPDQNEAVFTFVRALGQVNTPPPMVRLRGLDAGKRYRVLETGEVFGGDELMQVGLLCPVRQGDAQSVLYTLKAEEE